MEEYCKVNLELTDKLYGCFLKCRTPKTAQNDHIYKENPWLLGTNILGNLHVDILQVLFKVVPVFKPAFNWTFKDCLKTWFWLM